jgi:valyl-tRNA synthetase
METAYDILKAWVTRMVMLGLYITGEVPFKNVLFHGIVNDPYGKKMSKSKGNVVNPLELVDQYGADAVRFALIYGNATGNDQALSYTKLDGARKFTNKLWNIGRFIEMNRTENLKLKTQSIDELGKMTDNEADKEWIKKVSELCSETSKYFDSFQFNLAAERLYEFIWHEFADKYIEDVKNRIDERSFTILSSLFAIQLKLLHPIIPFITEELYRKFEPDKSIMIERWPQ